jgi:hypothetical protein
VTVGQQPLRNNWHGVALLAGSRREAYTSSLQRCFLYVENKPKKK